jgi:hypothetical protein
MFKHNFWPLDEAGLPIVDPKLMRPGEGGEKTIAHAMDLTLDDRGVPVAVLGGGGWDLSGEIMDMVAFLIISFLIFTRFHARVRVGYAIL